MNNFAHSSIPLVYFFVFAALYSLAMALVLNWRYIIAYLRGRKIKIVTHKVDNRLRCIVRSTSFNGAPIMSMYLQEKTNKAIIPMWYPASGSVTVILQEAPDGIPDQVVALLKNPKGIISYANGQGVVEYRPPEGFSLKERINDMCADYYKQTKRKLMAQREADKHMKSL